MTRPKMQLDIHNYEKQFAFAERQVRNSEISQHNKDLILRYRDASLRTNVCGKVRLIRVMSVLLLFARMIKKDLDTLDRPDVERIVTTILTRAPPYSPETVGTYKAILKRFVTWVSSPDTFPHATPPPSVQWITSHVRRKDRRRLQRNDLLTPADIDKLLETSHNTRDRALVSMLWETGCRVAELGNLRIKDITKGQQAGYLLDVTGKTGQRTPVIISSAPALAQWLNQHPFHDDPEAPLWVYYPTHTPTPKLLQYQAIRSCLQRLFKKAGLSKPFHPHIFRHSRATYVLAEGIMNEPQAKTYFGWSPSSDMLATYSHLVSSDANQAILKENNLDIARPRQDHLVTRTCQICDEINPAQNEYCTRCGAVLDLKRAYSHQAAHGISHDLFSQLFRILVEKGLVDEAARTVHDANLGAALKALATEHPRPAERRLVNAHAWHEPTREAQGDARPVALGEVHEVR